MNSRSNRVYILILICLLFLLLSISGWSRIKEPVEPESPEIKFSNNVSGFNKSSTRQCSVKFAGGRILTGKVDFRQSSIEYVPDKKAVKLQKEKISSISRIEFLKWKPSPKGAGSFLFSPSYIIIHKSDGSKEAARELKSLSRLKLKSKKKDIVCHFCFYEYRKAGVWTNSGKKELSYPEKNPPKETVVSIDFIKSGEVDLIRLLLKAGSGR